MAGNSSQQLTELGEECPNEEHRADHQVAVGVADGGDARPVGHGVGKVQQDGEKVIKVAGISWEDASKVKGIVDVGDDKENVCLVVFGNELSY